MCKYRGLDARVLPVVVVVVAVAAAACRAWPWWEPAPGRRCVIRSTKLGSHVSSTNEAGIRGYRGSFPVREWAEFCFVP